MRTYRELFRSPEFTPLFLTSAAQVAGSTVSGLALGTLVYAATGSPLLSALSMFGPSLAQLAARVVEGDLSARVVKTFPIDEFKQGYELIAKGGVRGKIVFTL